MGTRFRKYGFVYIWYDKKRRMYYIGCHWGTIHDGHICSSNRMRNCYRRRPRDFKRRILEITDRNNLFEAENDWLQLIKDHELNVKYYNKKKYKWHYYFDLSKTNPFVGKKHSIESRLKMSEAAKKRGSNFKGKRHSDETKLKMKIAKKRNPKQQNL